MPHEAAITVLALDLDGTIVARDKVTDRTARAIGAFRESGRDIVLASGRSRKSALRWAERLGGVSGMICYNGAAVYDGPSANGLIGAPIHVDPLPEEAARRLVALSRGLALHFHGNVGESYLYERRLAGTAIYEERSKFGGELVDFDAMPTLDFFKAVFLGPDDELELVAPRAREACGDAVSVFFSGPGFLEIVRAGVSKATGLEAWLGRRGRSLTEVLAFGDAENDERMLLEAGIGVAMANAPARLRGLVGSCAPSVDEDGVAVYLEGFLAEEGATRRRIIRLPIS
jgi:Cof subfamily protein (haloacid dehalogenase superfamily)